MGWFADWPLIGLGMVAETTHYPCIINENVVSAGLLETKQMGLHL